MKILIQNYATNLSTESMYFHKCIEQAQGEAMLWGDPNISVYDIFDSSSPDVFICHFSHITNDVIKYLSGSKIDIVTNVTGADSNALKIIEDAFTANKIKCPLMFTNIHEMIYPVKQNKIKLVNILPGLDVFLPKVETPMFKVGSCIISTKRSQLLESLLDSRKSYHLISVGEEKGDFDLHANIRYLISLLDKYNECVLVDNLPITMSQLFYEISFRCNKVLLKVEDEQEKTLNKMFSILFNDPGDYSDVGNIVKEQIKRRHNCFNRTSRLLKHLGDENLSNKVKSIGESL